MTRTEVVRIVRQYLQAQPRPKPMVGITLDVLEDDIYEERYAWRVPIVPGRQPRWMYAYYEVLAEVEVDLQEKENLNALFVPVFPEEAAPLVA